VPMFIGSSTIGNNLFIAGDAPMLPLFGVNQAWGQVPGFDMSFVPEPTVAGLAGIGLALVTITRLRGRNSALGSF